MTPAPKRLTHPRTLRWGEQIDKHHDTIKELLDEVMVYRSQPTQDGRTETLIRLEAALWEAVDGLDMASRYAEEAERMTRK